MVPGMPISTVGQSRIPVSPRQGGGRNNVKGKTVPVGAQSEAVAKQRIYQNADGHGRRVTIKVSQEPVERVQSFNKAALPKSYTPERMGGFSANDLSKFCPVPNRRLENKFRWFYKPYNYTTNTAKYMDFSSESSSDSEGYYHSAFPELNCSPWTRERPENQEFHS